MIYCLRPIEESKPSPLQWIDRPGNMDSSKIVPDVSLYAMQGSWLPEVKRMVGVVDEHFRRMLRNMGCNGQVSLYCGCPEFDGCNAFDKYAIHIRVKFRDEEALQLLTANRQSGGERAVCTILYIIALQVTLCFTYHPCFGPATNLTMQSAHHGAHLETSAQRSYKYTLVRLAASMPAADSLPCRWACLKKYNPHCIDFMTLQAVSSLPLPADCGASSTVKLDHMSPLRLLWGGYAACYGDAIPGGG